MWQYVFLFLTLSSALFAQGTQTIDRYTYTRIFEEVRHSVGTVLVERYQETQFGPPRIVETGGTGVVVDMNGYIITNAHVIKNAMRIRVRFSRVDLFDADIVGNASDMDIALIKLKMVPRDMRPARFGNSDSIKIGEPVMAIGAPFGLDESVTIGFISARSYIALPGSPMNPPYRFIQINAAINPGNSGGPLVNLDGKVVGITTAIIDPNRGSGIGFCIPINVVKKAFEEIKNNKQNIRGWIGVSVIDIDNRLQAHFKISEKKGVLISHVEEKSTGSSAGLKQGYSIFKINEQTIDDRAAFEWFIRTQIPGDSITVIFMKPPYTLEEQTIVRVEKAPR